MFMSIAGRYNRYQILENILQIIQGVLSKRFSEKRVHFVWNGSFLIPVKRVCLVKSNTYWSTQ